MLANIGIPALKDLFSSLFVDLSSDLVCVGPAFGCLDGLFSKHPLLGHLIKIHCILNEPKKRETGWSVDRLCFGQDKGHTILG
jgi:hypothetical protein